MADNAQKVSTLCWDCFKISKCQEASKGNRETYVTIMHRQYPRITVTNLVSQQLPASEKPWLIVLYFALCFLEQYSFKL